MKRKILLVLMMCLLLVPTVAFANNGDDTVTADYGVEDPLNWLKDAEDDGTFTPLQKVLKSLGFGIFSTVQLMVQMAISIVGTWLVLTFLVNRKNAQKVSDWKSEFGYYITIVALFVGMFKIVQLVHSAIAGVTVAAGTVDPGLFAAIDAVSQFAQRV